ncbi:MAG TPA: VWA domain-containing protein [Xanthomonadales bacterium]|nr:VWA domain-containing protein [Xanthomonadales bacterium]
MRATRLAVSIAVALTVGFIGCAQRSAEEARDQDGPVPRELAAQPAVGASMPQRARKSEADVHLPRLEMKAIAPPASPPVMAEALPYDAANTENYAAVDDNGVMRAAESPVSTFSIDVDTGAYSNVRRMLVQGQLPPADAVRTEEFVNYFDYGYEAPRSAATPFAVHTEIAPAPWNRDRHLLLVGIKGYEVDAAAIPASNLVFLVDTSGSMHDANKLPLVKESLKALVARLRPQDRISLVVYAGSAGLVLPPTSGADKATIVAALDALEAGGSTNGGEGIALAYAMAERAYIRGGVNRVILASDGDFNVGTTSVEALKSMVADKREGGIALTTLGFGMGNYNDEMAEQLADAGNGNHAYVDTLREANKVLVEELSSTMLTIAQDVKIQVEFNPAQVAEYRLIGYENRMLRREDFANDRIDAGEIGAGHDVTALYELTLVGSPALRIEPLRYAAPAGGAEAPTAATLASAELAHLRLRYKFPGERTSRLIERPLDRDEIQPHPGPRLQLAAAVAGFAESLRGGAQLGTFDLADVSMLARGVSLPDPFGYRAELVELIERAAAMKSPAPVAEVAIAR